MLGIVLEDRSAADRFKYMIKRYLLFRHFLLSVLRNPKLLSVCLGTDSIEGSMDIKRIDRFHCSILHH